MYVHKYKGKTGNTQTTLLLYSYVRVYAINVLGKNFKFIEKRGTLAIGAGRGHGRCSRREEGAISSTKVIKKRGKSEKLAVEK